jgi:glycosyltransferase involved in cell wall biosynthesis
MRHRNQRYAFLVSSPLDLRRGYGTAAAVLGLMQALHRRGKRVGLLEPSPSPLPERLAGWWFNCYVPRTLAGLDVDCVVGIDFDGYRYARRAKRRPFVSLLHGVKADELPWETGAPRSRLIRAARRESVAARHADLVIAPSAYACRRACEEYGVDPSRTRVVPNGIDLDHWPPLPPAGGPPRVVAAGRLIRRKGLDILVSAWPAVAEAVKGAVLDIVGDGPERDALTRLAATLGVSSSVRFHGATSQSELRQLLLGGCVFCFPSRQEAFGLALLEAMACGRAVVAASAASIPEVAGDAAMLVEPGSPEALSSALVHVLSDPALQTALAERGRVRALGFTWDRAAALFGEAAATA